MRRRSSLSSLVAASCLVCVGCQGYNFFGPAPKTTVTTPKDPKPASALAKPGGPRTQTVSVPSALVGIDERGGAFDATMVKFQVSNAV